MCWSIELYETARGVTVLDEAAKELTHHQLAALKRSLERLERHGSALGSSFFTKLKGRRELWEYRTTAQNIEIRALYVVEDGTYKILVVFKHKDANDADRHADKAESRLLDWRNRK